MVIEQLDGWRLDTGRHIIFLKKADGWTREKAEQVSLHGERYYKLGYEDALEVIEEETEKKWDCT